jgi:The GLUG motif
MKTRRNLICALAVFAVSAVMAPVAQAALVVSKRPTANVNCSTNYCTATAADAVMNVDDLKALLKQHNQWLDAGNTAPSIVFATPFRFSKPYVLTLYAQSGAIIIKRSISVLGKGGLYFNTNAGLSLQNGSTIDFWDLGGQLQINDEAYQLVGDVASLGKGVSGGFGHFALARDYDAGQDGIYKTSPGTGYFQGDIEGLGHTISNLSINDPTASDNVGLISYLYFGSIRDLGLINANIVGGQSAYVGGLAGQSQGTIEHSSVSGTVSGASALEVGGLVGFATDSGQFVSSYSAASVSGGNRAGGLVSTFDGTSITDCFASGAVTVSDGGTAGGLVGVIGSGGLAGPVTYSFATGPVQGGANAIAGGFVGATVDGIEYSYAKGAVSAGASSTVGGFAGYVGGSRVDQDYATGSATGGDNSVVGGFVGNNAYSDIRYVYALGAVSTGTGGAAGGVLGSQQHLLSYAYSTGAVTGLSGSTLGGAVGTDQGRKDIFRAYWDTDSSGISNPSQGAGSRANDYGIDGLTTSQFQSELPKGFDRQFWRQDPAINNGVPYLRALPPQ